MPIYLYVCTYCHIENHSPIRADNLDLCPVCFAGTLQRKWSVNHPAPFTPHFNHSVGSYVTSIHDFDEKLKVHGDSQETTLTRLDPGDIPRPTKDDQVFDDQMRQLTEKGFVSSQGKVTLDDSGDFVPQ